MVRWFPSPRTFQHNQLIDLGGAAEQPPLLVMFVSKHSQIFLDDILLLNVLRQKPQNGIFPGLLFEQDH